MEFGRKREREILALRDEISRRGMGVLLKRERAPSGERKDGARHRGAP